MIYQTAPFSMTLNDPYIPVPAVSRWRWISDKRCDIET